MLNFKFIKDNIFFKELQLITTGSIIFFLTKLILVYLNDVSNLIDIKIAYFLIHILLFFLSWQYHSRISFSNKNQTTSFTRYFKINFLIKFLDYVILISLNSLTNTNNILLVMITSFLIFFIRFIFLKTYVFPNK
jgi:hypothetical protein